MLSVIVYAGIFIVIVFFIATWGIKILFNASLFVANMNNDKKVDTTLNKNEDFIGNIEINSIPTATNSARFIVEGSVMNFDKLDFYINEEKVKSSSLTDSDNFSVEIGDLKKGDNNVYIIAKTKDAKKSKKSAEFKIFFKNEKPKLDIKEPADQSKTSRQEINVTGTTEKETFVKVNDMPVVVDAQGNFQTSVRLKDGENKIVLEATDIAGNVENKTITVTYQKDD